MCVTAGKKTGRKYPPCFFGCDPVEQLELVATTPAAALGSVRLKPGKAECEKVFEVFRKNDVRYFFYIGGNDSALMV